MGFPLQSAPTNQQASYGNYLLLRLQLHVSQRSRPRQKMATIVSQLELVTKQMTKSVVKLQTASYFEPCLVAQRPLKLSQAYCLLWQENESGDVDGRRCSFELLGGAVAAALLDLVVLGRIELEVAPKSALGFSYKKNYVKVMIRFRLTKFRECF